MHSEKPRFAAAVLSLLAFLVCPALALLAIYAGKVLLIARPKDVPLWGSLVSLILFAGGMLMLTWTSYMAGRDLWNLGSWGRRIVVESSAVVFLYALGM